MIQGTRRDVYSLVHEQRCNAASTYKGSAINRAKLRTPKKGEKQGISLDQEIA